MGFFGTFSGWLDGQLTSYIGNNTAQLSATLEPTVVALGTLYVMLWGYLQLTGKIEEPFIEGLRRICLLTLVLGAALQLWLYNEVIVDAFYDAPAQLAAAITGAASPVTTLDAVWQAAGNVANQLWDRASYHLSDVGFYIAGLLVWMVMGLVCCYAMFLIALSKIALTVLLALGPLFIIFRLFEGTRRLFDAWLMQLANYAFITVLTVQLGALLLGLLQSYATQTAARGAALLTVDALDMLLAAVIVLLVLRQIMPIAASLAGGSSLSSMSMSRGLSTLGRHIGASGKAGAVLGFVKARALHRRWARGGVSDVRSVP
jgi:type IV secretion system protein VirB6